MDNYFIHTFELSYRTTLENILELTDHGLAEIHGEFKSLKYTDMGITIISRKCTKEAKDGKGNYKLILIVNPSKLIEHGSYSNEITDADDLIYALGILGTTIKTILPKLSLNDMKLSRLDITTDIHGIPEFIIQEYIRIMRRSTLSRGYKLNCDLEENTVDFRRADSCNVCSKSWGAEFVVYNKRRASMDQGYPPEYLIFFKDTMRVELRCSRRYINKIAGKLSAVESLLLIYSKRVELVRAFYENMFKYRTDLCYVSKRWQLIFIEKRFGGKKTAKKIIEYIRKLNDLGVKSDAALYESCNTEKSRTRTPSLFNDLGFSPVHILDKTISYMSSLDTVLGFSDVDVKGRCYKKIKHSKGRKKVIFRYEEYRLSDYL